MSGVKKPNEKHLMLFSGRAYPELADEVSSLMGVDLVPTRALNYANSEIYVRFEESVRGSDAFVIQSHTAPVNEWVMEQLIMVDALKRASVKRITVVAPFYPYARQDKKHRGREPISARLIADLFKTAGADRLLAGLGKEVGFELTTPWAKLPAKAKKAILEGKDFKVEVAYRNRFGRERRYPVSNGFSG